MAVTPSGVGVFSASVSQPPFPFCAAVSVVPSVVSGSMVLATLLRPYIAEVRGFCASVHVTYITSVFVKWL
jgi:hypothetical protein